MARTKYVIALNEEERNTLNRIITEKTESDRTILRSRILLMSDVNTAEKMSIPKLADQLGTTHTTVQTVSAEYGKYGLEAAVYRKIRTDNRKVTPKVEEGIKQEIWQKYYENGEYLRSVESGTEDNYNMIDGIRNNRRRQAQAQEAQESEKHAPVRIESAEREPGKRGHLKDACRASMGRTS